MGFAPRGTYGRPEPSVGFADGFLEIAVGAWLYKCGSSFQEGGCLHLLGVQSNFYPRGRLVASNCLHDLLSTLVANKIGRQSFNSVNMSLVHSRRLVKILRLKINNPFTCGKLISHNLQSKKAHS